MINTQHSINVNRITKIHTETNTNKRKLIEAILINNTNNINIHKTNYNFDSISNSLITKNINIIHRMLSAINDPNRGIT